VISLDVDIIILIKKEKSSVILNLLLWSNFIHRRGGKFRKLGGILLDIRNVLLATIKFVLVVNVFFVKTGTFTMVYRVCLEIAAIDR
jgi:hypothetical protein